jgi:hypothetical protein
MKTQVARKTWQQQALRAAIRWRSRFNAEVGSEEKTVVHVGETIKHDNCNRPPTAPGAIVKPLGRGGGVDPDHRNCDDPIKK